MKDLRYELIQVAAVAVAAIQCLDSGEANALILSDDLLEEIRRERCKQDMKWGLQRHNPLEWMGILGEEYGEACKAALQIRFWVTP